MFILKCRIILVLVRLRCSCWGTIGALASVVLLFPNVRPVVSDEQSEEFRRSVSSSPAQKNKRFCFSEQEKNR